MVDLIEKMLADRKRVLVIGDAMLDEWIEGTFVPGQDGVQTFRESKTIIVPGGAANSGHQLKHWPVEVWLCSVGLSHDRWYGMNCELCFPEGEIAVKSRFVVDGRIVFRHDQEQLKFVDARGDCRGLAVKAVRNVHWDAVLVSDYDKGFLTNQMIEDIVEVCLRRGIPVVVDPKRSPHCCRKATAVKCNADYVARFGSAVDTVETLVITRGSQYPVLRMNSGTGPLQPTVPCVNHVGAGDCFSAHLALALAHSLEMPEAVRLAHAAGRAYVQRPYNHPPHPLEIAKDLDPVGGKIVPQDKVEGIPLSGAVVFTNGVWRMPHAGHAWLLDWAKHQGDVLVVGINDDPSAAALRPGEYVMPLAERARMLASMSCVDWVVPFSEQDPCNIIAALQPHALVKGSEYTGQTVPGDDQVGEVLFAPPGPFPDHASDLVAAIQG